MNNEKGELRAPDLATAHWMKSSYSAGENDCVEIAILPGGARAVRDSKHPEREPLCSTASAWAAFVQGVLGGEV
ncbi:DUF397 domain-containing protein [Streptomyces sp. NPDC057682]|uniref:DUF397 domain-containing protein n=1 Tax=Streptomyces sp. NPDC057682 TaxID=3346210 RepID=UPI00368EB785